MKGGLELTMTSESVREPWYKRWARDRGAVAPKDTIPQELADGWTEVMSEAVRFFHEPGFVMLPAVDYVDNLSDDEVKQRIKGYQRGYDKEYLRQQLHAEHGTSGYESFAAEQYRFSELPMEIQRAVVSRWDRLHCEYIANHPGLTYRYGEGYYWEVEGAVIPYLDMDNGRKPREEVLLQAEAAIETWEELERRGAQLDMSWLERESLEEEATNG